MPHVMKSVNTCRGVCGVVCVCEHEAGVLKPACNPEQSSPPSINHSPSLQTSFHKAAS
jgi:hypothetical protein